MIGNLTVSVVIPALNEEATVAHVAQACLASCADEVLVIDSDSTDNTAAEAARVGARVVGWRGVDKQKPWPGKGEALWRGVKAARGDVVVFVDADVTNVEPWWVDTLAAPFADPAIHLVNATYERLGAGGRVTELTAKPLLRTYFPQLASLDQPLAGEYAIRRETALQVPFVAGYGVEVGLLIDVYATHPNAITQVNLGKRTHRNRPLSELGPMADVVTRTVLSRAGVLPEGAAPLKQRPPWNKM